MNTIGYVKLEGESTEFFIQENGKVSYWPCFVGSLPDTDDTLEDLEQFDSLGDALNNAFPFRVIIDLNDLNEEDRVVFDHLIKPEYNSPMARIENFIVLGEPFEIERKYEDENEDEDGEDYQRMILDRSPAGLEDFDITDCMRMPRESWFSGSTGTSYFSGYYVKLTDCGDAAWLFQVCY